MNEQTLQTKPSAEPKVRFFPNPLGHFIFLPHDTFPANTAPPAGASGLKTNWYCAGEEPVCCRDSTTTWDEGIPWACIPADGLCCGHGDYCSSGSTCVRDGSDYACRSSSGHELSSLVGNTPEGESDWSGVDGGDDDDDDDKKGAASTLRLRLPMMEACGIALGVMLLL